MHRMIFNLVLFYRAECPETDMQRDRTDRNAFCTDFIQKLGSKVKAGSRRCCAAQFTGIDRLVTLTVIEFFLDVRGEGHFAEAVQNFEKNSPIQEAYDAVPVRQHGFNHCTEFTGPEDDFSAFTEPSARTAEALPAISAKVPQKNQFRCAPACPVAQQPGGENSGIIDDQAVAFPQQRRQFVKHAVCQRSALPVEAKQPGMIAFWNRSLRDQFRRKIIVKVGFFHPYSP